MPIGAWSDFCFLRVPAKSSESSGTLPIERLVVDPRCTEARRDDAPHGPGAADQFDAASGLFRLGISSMLGPQGFEASPDCRTKAWSEYVEDGLEENG